MGPTNASITYCSWNLDDITFTANPICPGDVNSDGKIDLTDLATLLGSYGETEGVTYRDGDVDGDGEIDLVDLAVLLGVYGTTCEY